MTTPLMSLNEIITGVGGDSPSAAWNKLILNFQKLDSHNHTEGNGAKITTGALNIDNNLNINTFALTNAKQIQFTNLSSALTDNYGLFVVNNNLVFRSSTTTIALTTGGSAIAGNPGNILNMGATQSVSYNSGFFQFFQDTSILGFLKTGGVSIGSSVTPNASNFVVLQADPSSGYTLTFPAADPAANQMLLTDGSGVLSWVDAIYKSGTVASNQVILGDGANSLKGLTLSANHLVLGTGGLPVSGQLVNAYVDAAAAIAGTKISPNFGAQNVVTTGTLQAGSSTLSALTVSTTTTTAGIISTGANNFSNSAQTFTVAGPSTFNNNVSIPSAPLTIGGVTTFNGNVAVNGNITTNVLPNVTNTYQLGSSSNRWLALHARDVTSYGATVLGASSSDNITFNARAASTLNPASNNAYDLGASSLRWATVFGQNMDTNTLTVNSTTNVSTINTGAINTAGFILPTSNLSLNIGSASLRFANMYAGQFHANGNIFVSTGNGTGNGIYLADDGEIVDMNDAACTMRFNDGVKVTAGKGNNTLAHHLDNDGILYNARVVSSQLLQAPVGYFNSFYNNEFSQGTVVAWNSVGGGRTVFHNNRGLGIGGFVFVNSNAATGNPSNPAAYTETNYFTPDGKVGQRAESPVGWKTFSGGSLSNATGVTLDIGAGTITGVTGVYAQGGFANYGMMGAAAGSAGVRVTAAGPSNNQVQIYNITGSTISSWRVIVFYV